MFVKSEKTNPDFFVRSGGGNVRTRQRNESDYESSVDRGESTERSTPGRSKVRKSRKTAFAVSNDDDSEGRRSSIDEDDYSRHEEDEETEVSLPIPKKRSTKTFEEHVELTPIKERQPRPSTARKQRPAPVNRYGSRRSMMSTEYESDDQESMRKLENSENNNDIESETESTSTLQPVTPVNKKTSADLLAEESSQLMLSQGIPEGNFWNVLTYAPPKHKPKADVEAWSKLTFFPSSLPVKSKDKLFDDEEARKVEDDGLYIGEPLKLPARNLNRLEDRLIKENSLDWFGPDGKIVGFSDPYRAEPVKLCHNQIKEAEFQRNIIFVPARLDPFQEMLIDPRQSYEMVLELGTIQFTYHPVFSKEHVLSSKLEEAYAEYTTRNLMRITDRSINKLKALREAISHTKEAYQNTLDKLENVASVSEKGLLKGSLKTFEERIKNYRKEIQKTSLDRDQGFWDDRAALLNVLELWRDLKNMRRDQGYSNTSLKLSILEIAVDSKEDKAVWQNAIQEEFNDLKEEHEESYEADMKKYNIKMKKWLEKRKKEKQEKLRRNSKDDSDSEDTSAMYDDPIHGKPIPPSKFDAEGTLIAIEKRHSEVRRHPGEPVLKLDLLRTNEITSTNQLPTGSNKEIQRRKIVEKLKVEVKIWFNGKEVYTSHPKGIQGDFSGFLGLSIPISIKERPDSLDIEVIDIITKFKCDRMNVQLPNSKTSIDRCHTQSLPFESSDSVKVTHAGVGSGDAFEVMGKEYPAQYPHGFITTRVGWSIDIDGNLNCPSGLDKLYSQEEATSTDPERLKSSQQTTKAKTSAEFDPNDPKNAQWHSMKFRKQKDELKQQQLASDHLTSPQDAEGEEDEDGGAESEDQMNEFDFCTMESIEKSARYRLLQLRDEEVPEFKGLKMIPAFEYDIPLDIFSQYERRLKDDLRKRSGADPALLKPSRKKIFDDESLYESNRLEKIREMRLSILQLFESSTKQITFEDLVIEEQIPDIGTLGLNLMALFQPRRPLRPTRKERKRVQGSNLIDARISLIVNIVRAFNLPMRKDADVGLLTTESLTGVQLSSKRIERAAGNYATVKPFVEVWFQRSVCRTTTALGSNPTWNQELQLNLSVPNDDFSQANLSRMDDLVYFHVYDEVAIDLLEDDRRRETDIHQRLEKRWLGTISIPFATLYTNGRIEGTFKLNSPSILLGYEAQGMASHFGSIVGKLQQSTATDKMFSGKGHHGTPFSNEKNAFITIFLTMQPSVTPMSNFKEDSHSGETPDMVAHIKSWKNLYEARFPDRIIKPFVMTSEGNTILCTRFLKPIEPPNSLIVNDGNELLRTMEDLAHYVSLFPCVRDSTLGIVDYSLWFTSDVFISAPGGGIEDHSVLLACFFMHLNVPCWIVQGNAIPDGPTTFVVTSLKDIEEKQISKQLKNAIIIWNACTGDHYHVNDNFCPLQSVWAVVGNSNIWANIGEGERPHQLEWDFTKSKSWQPLFGKPVSEDKIPCVQTASIRYKPADQVQANSLAQRIERNLKEVFMKWRPTSKTNWNRYCSATLRRLLPKLEESKLGRTRSLDSGTTAESAATFQSGSGSNISLSEEHLIELREIMTSYQMTGFPLQQPYTNMESIIETVYATGVHTIDAPDVEFAVAAYAHAYPASVYSVWVYVAALHRRK